jgi:hypothetical protein
MTTKVCENFETVGINKITDNVILCMRLCVKNKDLWKNNKVKMIMLMRDTYPLFYSQFPRIIHCIGNCDNIQHLNNMLILLFEVDNGKMSINDAHKQFNDINDKTYAGELIREIKEKENK